MADDPNTDDNRSVQSKNEDLNREPELLGDESVAELLEQDEADDDEQYVYFKLGSDVSDQNSETVMEDSKNDLGGTNPPNLTPARNLPVPSQMFADEPLLFDFDERMTRGGVDSQLADLSDNLRAEIQDTSQAMSENIESILNRTLGLGIRVTVSLEKVNSRLDALEQRMSNLEAKVTSISHHLPSQ